MQLARLQRQLDAKAHKKQASNFFQPLPHLGIGAHPLCQIVRQQGGTQAVQKGKECNGGGHEGVGHQTPLAGTVYKQRKESHVKQDGLGIEQGDEQGLPQVMAHLDVEHGGGAGFGGEHLETQPGQIGSTDPLHSVKGVGVRGQQRRHARHGRPHQHLVPKNDAHCCSQSAGNAPFAGGRHQCQIARAWNGQKHNNRDDKGAVIGDAEHDGFLSGEGWSLRWNHVRRRGLISEASNCAAGDVSRETLGDGDEALFWAGTSNKTNAGWLGWRVLRR